VIPAAGKGTRLGSKTPKALYRILGRPLIEWVLRALSPVCGHFVIIAAPDTRLAIQDELENQVAGKYTLLVQEQATGMGDAILLSEATIFSEYVAIAWADQVTLTEETVRMCAALHESRSGSVLTLPTVIRERPYVLIERSPDNKIKRIRQSRESAMDSAVGENDCGLFMFSREPLFATLRRAKARGTGLGTSTGEFDLVKLLPSFEGAPNAVLSVRLKDATESLGVNTPDDAVLATGILASRNTTIA